MASAAAGWIKLATKLIKANGQTLPIYIVRTRDGENNYVPAQLKTPSPDGGDLAYEFVGAPIDFKLVDIDKLTIMSGERMLWIPGTTTADEAFIPEVGDTVYLYNGDGPEYRINEVTSFETQSVNCAFLLKIGA